MASCSTHQPSIGTAYAAGSAAWHAAGTAQLPDPSARHYACIEPNTAATLKRHRSASTSLDAQQAGPTGLDQRFGGAAADSTLGAQSAFSKTADAGSMRQYHTLDDGLSASVRSGLAPPPFLDWEAPHAPDSFVPVGAAAIAAGPSGTGMDHEHQHSFCVKSKSDSLVQIGRQPQTLIIGSHSCYSSSAADATAAADSSSMLYSSFRSSHSYAAADPPASNQGYAVDTHSSRLAADRALRAHQHQQQQQQQMLLRQHQLQRQQAEAAAAAQAAYQQLLFTQQQAALARSAVAVAGHAAVLPASHPVAAPAHVASLYGNYHPSAGRHQWDTTCVAAASAASSYSHQTAAASLEQQRQHRQIAGGARLPPKPAVSGSHTQHPSSSGHMTQQFYHPQQQYYPQQQQQQQEQAHGINIGSSTFPAAAACGGGAAGRWSGQVAFMDAAIIGSQDSDAGTGGFSGLECHEDLLSMETGEGYYQHLHLSRSGSGGAAAAAAAAMQQQHQQQHYIDMQEVEDELADLIEESGSTHGSDGYPSDDMDDDGGPEGQAGPEEIQPDAVRPQDQPAQPDQAMLEEVDVAALVAARAAAVAAEQAAAAHQSAVLQVLGRVASLRKGAAVLTATPAAAARAGAESVRGRLVITEVSLYCELAANSQMALDQANKLLAKMVLPDDITYMPVLSDSFLFKAGAAWQFPAFVICLGSSYLQRMLKRLPQLADAAMACPGFEDYSSCLQDAHRNPPQQLSGPEAVATLATLRSVQFTCLFLATKAVDQVHALGLLRFMLTNLSHNGAVVSTQQAADVEARCLDALAWRLGPFFLEDELRGDDEELWADGMGHWDYGSENDTYSESF